MTDRGPGPEKVLIYRLGSIGDAVVSLPCFRLVAKAFPSSERILLTNIREGAKAAHFETILTGTGLVHRYINYPLGMRNPGTIKKLWSVIQRERMRTLVYLAAPRGVWKARRDVLFFRLCGLKELIGVPVTEEMQFSQPDEHECLWEPEAARLARCIRSLGDAAVHDVANWDLKLTDLEIATARRALGDMLNGQRLIAFSVGAKVDAKDWGQDRWLELMDRLAVVLPDYNAMFVGSSDEAGRTDQLRYKWRGPSVNLCGRLSPRESAAALTYATLFVGHDSGPMHLAAAVRTPVVAIFSARNKPGTWFPVGEKNHVIYHRTLCFGCNFEVCEQEKKRCIRSISVEEVVTAIVTALGPQTRKRSKGTGSARNAFTGDAS